MKQNKPLVSVVITTKNEEKNIEACIKSILKQSYPKIEIIVVDNNSEDKTKEIARKYTKKVYNKGPERSEQRNFGMFNGNGNYVMYVDADMTFSKNVISEAVKACKNNDKLKGIYIPEIIVGKGFWIKVRRFERIFYDGTVVDCVRFMPKKAFIEVSGFDTSLTGPEDWDLDKKIRNVGETAVLKSHIYHNEGNFNLKKYLQKKGYYAKSFDKYIAKWGKNDADIKKQLGFYYRFLGVFIENGKWKRFIAHPLLVFSMYFLRFLVGIKFVMRKK